MKKQKQKKPWWVELLSWVATILAAAIVALLVKGFVVELVRVDGESMLDTLQHGEIMVVTKYDYGSFWTALPWQSTEAQELSTRFNIGGGTINRFDVAVVRYPGSGTINYVKRIVGLPGDRISLKDGFLYVNGAVCDEPYVSEKYRLADVESIGDEIVVDFLSNLDEFVIPRSGDLVTFVASAEEQGAVELLVNGQPGCWYGIASDLVDDDGNVLRVNVSGIYLNGEDMLGSDRLGELIGKQYKLKDDLYFVMGDHRNNSSDSRFIGPVNRSDIIGHVRQVVFPFADWRGVE